MIPFLLTLFKYVNFSVANGCVLLLSVRPHSAHCLPSWPPVRFTPPCGASSQQFLFFWGAVGFAPISLKIVLFDIFQKKREPTVRSICTTQRRCTYIQHDVHETRRKWRSESPTLGCFGPYLLAAPGPNPSAAVALLRPWHCCCNEYRGRHEDIRTTSTSWLFFKSTNLPPQMANSSVVVYTGMIGCALRQTQTGHTDPLVQCPVPHVTHEARRPFGSVWNVLNVSTEVKIRQKRYVCISSLPMLSKKIHTLLCAEPCRPLARRWNSLPHRCLKKIPKKPPEKSKNHPNSTASIQF